MEKVVMRQCKHCNMQFRLKRQNQFYCDNNCRIAANNRVAKERYATYKVAMPKVNKDQKELLALRKRLAGLTIVAQDIIEIGKGQIQYRRHIYRRTKKVGQPSSLVYLQPGGGVVIPGNKIIYRSKGATVSSDNCGEYEPDEYV